MKKQLFSIAIILVMLLALVSCGSLKKDTVYKAIKEIGTGTGGPFDNSDKFDLDERFDYFQYVELGGDSALRLKAKTGIVAYYFTPRQNIDGSLSCTLKGIHIRDVGNISFGSIEGDKNLGEFVDKLTFKLVLENNVVTSYDLPELIV